jgi:hypothetical protein
MKENISLDDFQKESDNKRLEISKKSNIEGSSSSAGKAKM